MAKDELGDLEKAALLYEELRGREPAEREIWQPLVAVYRALHDNQRLGKLLEETATIADTAEERATLRKERARMAMGADHEKAIQLLTDVVEDAPAGLGGGDDALRALG